MKVLNFSNFTLWNLTFFSVSTLTYNSSETSHFSIMKKLWDLKKVFSNLEPEGQGRGIIIGVTCLLPLGPFYTIKSNFMYFFAHDCTLLCHFYPTFSTFRILAYPRSKIHPLIFCTLGLCWMVNRTWRKKILTWKKSPALRNTEFGYFSLSVSTWYLSLATPPKHSRFWLLRHSAPLAVT